MGHGLLTWLVKPIMVYMTIFHSFNKDRTFQTIRRLIIVVMMKRNRSILWILFVVVWVSECVVDLTGRFDWMLDFDWIVWCVSSGWLFYYKRWNLSIIYTTWGYLYFYRGSYWGLRDGLKWLNNWPLYSAVSWVLFFLSLLILTYHSSIYVICRLGWVLLCNDRLSLSSPLLPARTHPSPPHHLYESHTN